MWEDAGTHGQRGWARLDDFLAPMARAWRRARRSWSSPLAARLARVSVEDWLDTVEADAQTRRSCRSLSRGMMLASPRRLSLLQLVDEWTGGGGGPRATFYRIRGGNDQLPQRLAAGLAESVVLRAPVTHVERTRRGCVVSARVGRKMRTFEGDGVVVALPPRPLLRVTFSPPLPARLHRALATIGFGGVTKSVLLLERSGWRRCGPGGAWGSDARAGSFWDAGEGQAGHPPLLSVFTGGDLAPAARRARSRPRWVAGHLPWDARADLRAGASVTWERERYVGGGYATFETEFDPTLRAALTQPLPRMAFAGEHTSRENQGYIEGAVESGERAAKELAALLR